MNSTSPILTAFARLTDRYNSVSLTDLRPAVALNRAAFDAELTSLRRAGVLTMSALEGRHGAAKAQLDACLVEHGEQLLFVHRRDTQ